MNVGLPAENPTISGMHDSSRSHEQRLPGLGWLPIKVKNLFIAALGEFVGTFLFLFFAFSGTQVANAAILPKSPTTPNVTVLLYIALSFGFSLAVNAWVFFRITGGMFNPAVSSLHSAPQACTKMPR